MESLENEKPVSQPSHRPWKPGDKARRAPTFPHSHSHGCCWSLSFKTKVRTACGWRHDCWVVTCGQIAPGDSDVGSGLHSEPVTVAGLVLRENRADVFRVDFLLRLGWTAGQSMGKSRVPADWIACLIVKLPCHPVDVEIAPGLLVLVGLDGAGLGDPLELLGVGLA